nr:alkene reductase [Novosphingobium panipatense]
MTETTTDLFEPVTLGDIALANRIVMAPLTRARACEDGVPTDLHATYYAQRASAGLIIAEATNITQQGRGYALTPGLWTEEQVAGWKKVTDAVHAAGGKIVSQLWHVGRFSHVSLQPDGKAPVAPSAIKAEGKTFTVDGMQDVSEPRALETDEIPGLIQDYVRAAENAKRAGFDGVEVHSANSYLLDQFIRDSTNKRTDQYGGPIENRTRLTQEIVEAVVGVWGSGRVGIRLSPTTPDAGNTPMDSTPSRCGHHRRNHKRAAPDIGSAGTNHQTHVAPVPAQQRSPGSNGSIGPVVTTGSRATFRFAWQRAR